MNSLYAKLPSRELPLLLSAEIDIILNSVNLYIESSDEKMVTLVEWLTRGPAIKLGRAFGRVGSNPAGDEIFLVFLGVPFLPCFLFELGS